MDDTLQKVLRKATQNARHLLEDEFEEQLDGRFDIRPDGTISDEPGPHLDAEERLLREKLVTAIGHREAGGMSAEEAVAAFLREAAFTTLNRFVALKMLEERGVVKESISEGLQSSGFKEFTMLAPGLSELSDGGYRLYLESLFDEIGQEVKVLFDRNVVAGRLWPRRPALEDLLEILNKDALADAWQETEAIGWVYQYFNEDSEREEMREESSTPRNSHEMAVRNQFFTPHYVVQFLTDNTLGRTWHEMREGDTRIREECDYFTEREGEVFLDEGEAPPESSSGSFNALSDAGENGESGVPAETSHEEDNEGPTYVPYRAKKDPRELKILDPACGSGHFLLYAFDLLWTIYEEAWEDPEAPAFEETGQTLSQDYESLDDLHSALPGLILEKNLYGVDIDPRATQIASFALWMRAQEAYSEIELSRDERPPIMKTNVVVAEPMPGDEELREEFIESLQPPALGQLVDAVFEKMELADEAGTLLRIEEEIRDAIKEAKNQWEEPKQLELLPEAKRNEYRQSGLFDVGSITNEEFWDTIEDQIYLELEKYAKRGVKNEGLKRKLFADDATAGFSFVDVCRNRYDTVLMNPPYGDFTKKVDNYARSEYLDTWKDIYACFIKRAKELSKEKGIIGALTSSTFFHRKQLEEVRKMLMDESPLRACADLGTGVLDGAAVEVAAFVYEESKTEKINSSVIYWDLADHSNQNKKINIKSFKRNDKNTSKKIDIQKFKVLEKSVFSFWLPKRLLDLWNDSQKFEPGIAEVAVGLTTFNNFRFLRLKWEIDNGELNNTWYRIVKGGEYGPYYSDEAIVALWEEKGKEMEANEIRKYDTNARTTQSKSFYFRSGITYPRVGKSFGPRVLQNKHLFESKGTCIFFHDDDKEKWLGWLAFLNSNVVEVLLRAFGRNRFWETSAVANLPISEKVKRNVKKMSEMGKSMVKCMQELESYSENSPLFVKPALYEKDISNINDTITKIKKEESKIDELSSRLIGIDKTEMEEIINSLSEGEEMPLSYFKKPSKRYYRILSYLFGVIFGRFDIRYALDENNTPKTPHPFESLPDSPPAMMKPTDIDSTMGNYPVDIAQSGILVDDPGRQNDIITRIKGAINTLNDEITETKIAKKLGESNLRSFFRKTTGFFRHHRKQYSKSRRKAPIYWQLALQSTDYSVWLYYPWLTQDTFYRVLDLVKEKIRHEERQLSDLREEAGNTSSSTQRSEIADQDDFVSELRGFRKEVERVAPLWNPSMNDGVVINHAPLWRLVQHNRSWQKECKKHWDRLVDGEYDWSHWAMHLWPERVVPKCAERRDLAIAHDLEEVFWEQDAESDWTARDEPARPVEELVEERTSQTVKSALEDLLNAPAHR